MATMTAIRALAVQAARAATFGLLAAAPAAALAAILAAAPGGALAQEAPRQTCWIGEIRRTLPTGEQFGVAGVLMRRTESPQANMILEQVVTLEPDEAPRELVTMFQVDGAKLVVTDRDASLNGQGDLIGEPWAWSGWTYRADYAAGTGSYRVTFTKTPTGLQAERTYFSPSGEVRMLMEENYRPVGVEVFDLLYRKLLAP